MDSLFGVPLTSIMIGLLILLALSLGVVGWVWLRQPILFRMGIRNLGRRPQQTALIVIGLTLSTLIISAAFTTGDTVGYSLTSGVYDTFEEVDIALAYDPARAHEGAPGHLTDGFLDELRAEFLVDADVDAITGVFARDLPVLNTRERLSEPSAVVVGVDPETIDELGALRSPGGDGVSAGVLGGDRFFVSRQLAEEINAGPGSRLHVFVGNEAQAVEVVDIVQDSSLTGAGIQLTGGGLVGHIDSVRRLDGDPGELSLIVFSALGGTRGSLDAANALQERIEDYLEETGAPAQIAFTKAEGVAAAELVGSIFVTFFLLFGLFSIAAGVMLIFLIFVMLAAERRSEMGMARAIGMRRLHLTEMFLAEGSGYNLFAAIVGALLGVAVAYGITWLVGIAFADFNFSIIFHVNPQGFVIAFALGVVLTFATIAFSSLRAANINIVRAIRDLPEPQPLRGADRSLAGIGRAAVGALWVLAWVALVSVWAAAAFGAFLVGLATYGLGVIALLLAMALFVLGTRSVPRGRFLPDNGWRTWLLWGLWICLFSVVALATLVLLNTRDWAARSRNAGGWALWMLVAGVVGLWLGGWVWGQAAPYSGGLTLVVLAAAMLAVYFGAATRAAFTTAAGLLLLFWLTPLPFSLIWDVTADDTDPVRLIAGLLPLIPEPREIAGNVEMFFVSGMAITVSSTLVVIFNAQLLLALLRGGGGVLRGIAPAIKMAVSYPLAARFRTGMTLAMFVLIVFSLVVMATLNYNFSQLFFSTDAKAGFDVVVDGNPSNQVGDLRPALAGSEVRDGELAGVGRTRSLFLRVGEEGRAPPAGDAEFYRLVDVDREFLEVAEIPLASRARGYDSDASVVEALLSDPGTAIADDAILGVEGFGPGGDLFTLSDARVEAIRGGDPYEPVRVTVSDPESGNVLELRIIGFMEAQVSGILPQLSGIFAHDAGIERLSADGRTTETFFVRAAGSPSTDDLEELADRIESTLLERGVQASAIQALIDDQARASTQFQLLFEAFMGLGLIVGIAALGVIAFRTVVERRQQIGMLRALGYTRKLVALSFFMESSFIALTGIALGLVLGTALSYNLLTDPAFTEGTEIAFRFPWVRILLISGIAYGASALMTLAPARAASRVPVAEALRYE